MVKKKPTCKDASPYIPSTSGLPSMDSCCDISADGRACKRPSNGDFLWSRVLFLHGCISVDANKQGFPVISHTANSEMVFPRVIVSLILFAS